MSKLLQTHRGAASEPHFLYLSLALKGEDLKRNPVVSACHGYTITNSNFITANSDKGLFLQSEL